MIKVFHWRIWLDEIEKVTKKDVCRVARQVKLQSLFFLEGVSRMAALKKRYYQKIDEEVIQQF